ncbi:MAG TPA: hypothetical protein VM616_06145 [Gammaproteobacteria bacterium]|nr:hypothetical protein [Gammaproteobacteria bacterium]
MPPHIESDKIVNLTFAQFGKHYAGAPNNYVYIYAVRVKYDSGLVIQKPGEIVLMRVAKTKLKNGNAYRFIAGMDGSMPIWRANIAEIAPVFEDSNGVGWTVSVSHNQGLNRYMLVTEHDVSGEGQIGIHEAPKPWGPWRTALYTNQGGAADTAFFWNFSNKWTNGRDFNLMFTGWDAVDSFNSVEGHFD